MANCTKCHFSGTLIDGLCIPCNFASIAEYYKDKKVAEEILKEKEFTCPNCGFVSQPGHGEQRVQTEDHDFSGTPARPTTEH